MIVSFNTTSAAGPMERKVRQRLIQIGGALSYLDATNARSTQVAFTETEQTNSGLTALDDMQPANAIMELKRLSGFTWEKLAELFGVARRSLHFWASGKPLNAVNEERLQRLLATVRQIDRGDAASNRRNLSSALNDGRLPLDLLVEGEYDEVVRLLGQPNHPALKPLSQQAAALRTPPKPDELVGALHDPVHRKTSRARVARSVRAKKKP